jgi:hypothetical protein
MITVQKVGPYTIAELDNLPPELKAIEGLTFVFTDPDGNLAGTTSEQSVTVANDIHTRRLVVSQYQGERIPWLDGFLAAARELRTT